MSPECFTTSPGCFVIKENCPRPKLGIVKRWQYGNGPKAEKKTAAPKPISAVYHSALSQKYLRGFDRPIRMTG